MNAMLCVASPAKFTLSKLQYKHVHLTELAIADSCGLMLTVKGMFMLSCTTMTINTDAQRSLMQTS